MIYKPVKICPICHKAFMYNGGEKKVNITCSAPCGVLYSQHDRHAKERLLELAEELKREPRTDCRMYMEYGACSALTALWCKYENCKFYKPREADNGKI